MAKAKKYLQYTDSDTAAGFITIKADHKNVVVNLKDIIVIEAMDNYVKIFRKDLPTVVPQITMKDIEARLPDDSFIRIHRSYIIAVPFIEKFANKTVYMHHFPGPFLPAVNILLFSTI